MGSDDITRVLGDEESDACLRVSRFADTDIHPRHREDYERGDTVDRYVIVAALGSGGMGRVYSAYDPELDRKVAIKTLHRRDLEPFDTEAVLLHEAKALARLSHPNIVNVYDAGTQDDRLFIAMEFIEGETLRDWSAAKKRSWREVLDVFLAAGRGLAAAHAEGIIHRDFKPPNVMIGPADRVRVVDFGLARPVEAHQKFDHTTELLKLPADSTASSGKTPLPIPDSIDDPDDSDGKIVFGTPAFMAPEQLEGLPVDERCDQFSFCVALYAALYGLRPFAGKSMQEIHASIKAGDIREPRKIQGPHRLRRHLLKGLALYPGDRYASMAELLSVLEADRRLPRRRAMALVGASGALAFGALGYLGALGTTSPSPCTDAERHLDGVWDSSTRDELEAAFSATNRPYAADTWRSVSKMLDEYGERWVEMHREACEATRVQGEQSEELLDLRMNCLERRRSALDALVRLFSEADETVVLEAVRAVTSLPELAPCSNRGMLTSSVAPPRDEQTAERVEALRGQLDEVETLYQAARYDEARKTLVTVMSEALSLGYDPLIAEARLLQGMLRAKTGDAERARGALMEAVWASTAAADERTEARAWTSLVNVSGQLARYDEAREQARHAEAVLARLGDEPDIQQDLASHVATVHAARGDYGRALASYEKALSIAEEAFGSEDPRVGAVVNNLGTVHGTMGNHERALDYFERSHQLALELFGEHHPTTATALNNIAISHEHLGRYEVARGYYERALAVRVDALGEHHPDVGSSHHNLGSVLSQEGRREEALEQYQKSLAIHIATLGPEHPNVGLTRNNVGAVLNDLERPREALAQLQQAETIFREKLGEEHPFLGHVYDSIGTAELALRHGDRAIDAYERALHIRRTRGEDLYLVALSELHLAQALDELGRTPERVRHLASSAREGLVAAKSRGAPALRDAKPFLDRVADAGSG